MFDINKDYLRHWTAFAILLDRDRGYLPQWMVKDLDTPRTEATGILLSMKQLALTGLLLPK